ncbi:hypothetical protein [Metabacillus litoralis]|uniref:hypothetical protein n=1 Tax=Metabacillus TaxID=2675233 RepID=UPI000EF58383|nr:hypothetical protein [Metabacillus litoralis]MCM3163889.1 hypothetical protein [Metabacillus litoralis]MCM3410598.1 hypothetical protein [Metabacillus litoralis]
MEVIANLPYITVKRNIEENILFHREEQHNITLSTSEITTSFETFLIKDVLDISYRIISKEIGFLYLHTTRGMYSFQMRSNPEQFIKEFKKIK